MKENLFILMGPTAVGKTSISIEMAKRLNGEIISADSMQIYKYMDIGTAKITKDEMQNIPHYMIDILYPDEAFTVANYKQLAAQHISKINSEGKLPLVVGGTGLYINSLVYKLNFASVPPNEEYRGELEKLADRYGNEYIYDMLLKIDIESGSRISIKDRKRIIRALEIYESTGKTMSEYNKDFRMENDDYNLSMICLNMSRDKLYSRINQRVDIMIEQGLVEEVRRILSMGYDRSLISLKGIGYKEIIMYLNNECTLEEAIDKIKQGSRNYAKRQLTWFRRDNRIKWIDVDDFQNMKEICDNIENYIIGNHTI